MSTPAALLRAIAADPADDTPRLVLADHLEEHGDPARARFIRTQIALAAVPEYDPQWAAARLRSDELIDGRPYLNDLPPLPDGLGWGRPAFRRGFPWKLAASDPQAFALHAGRAGELAPVEGLDADGRFRPELAPLLTSRHLSRVRWLRFVQWPFGPREWQQLADAPYTDGLTHLRAEPAFGAADDTGGWVAAAGAVAGSGWLPRLETLGLRGVGADGFVSLLEHAGRPPPLAVTTLDLSDTTLTDARLTRIVRGGLFADVTDLHIVRAEVSSFPGPLFFDHKRAARLRVLNLSNLRGDPPEVRLATGCQHLTELRSLSLRRARVRPRDAAALADAPFAPRLRFLDLSGNPLARKGLVALAATPLPDLAELRLMQCEADDVGAKALAASPHLPGLIHLDLSGNRLSAGAVAALRERFGDGLVI